MGQLPRYSEPVSYIYDKIGDRRIHVDALEELVYTNLKMGYSIFQTETLRQMKRSIPRLEKMLRERWQQHVDWLKTSARLVYVKRFNADEYTRILSEQRTALDD